MRQPYSEPIRLNPGADIRTRTGDLSLTKGVLYLLSYISIVRLRQRRRVAVERVAGIEPALPAWKAGVLPLNYTRAFRSRLRRLPYCFTATCKFGGGGRIRTFEGSAVRFTV